MKPKSEQNINLDCISIINYAETELKMFVKSKLNNEKINNIHVMFNLIKNILTCYLMFKI